MLAIPLYRAKCIDSDEYVEGDLFAGKFIIPISILNKKIFNAIKHIEEDVLSCSINEDCKNEHIELKNMLTKLIYNERLEHITEIDKTTLSVHFPETNIEDLFFGLDNGLGASIIEAVFVDDISPFKGIAMHSHYGYVFFDKNNDWVHINKLKDIKVIGIQK